MADNGWMYSGRISATNKTDDWVRNTHLLVNELARGSKAMVRALCPCAHCTKRHRQGKDDMYKHLLQYGYMSNYVTQVDFARYERDRGEVMRQRLNGNEHDGIRNMLDDLIDADQPNSPPPREESPEPEEPLEPEEPEPTAKAFLDMMAAAKRPLYEGAKISQLDAISQCLADKCQYSATRSHFEANLRTCGNMLPEGHCLPKTMYKVKKIVRALNMEYEKIDCCPKGCLLFWKQFEGDKYCSICKASI